MEKVFWLFVFLFVFLFCPFFYILLFHLVWFGLVLLVFFFFLLLVGSWQWLSSNFSVEGGNMFLPVLLLWFNTKTVTRVTFLQAFNPWYCGHALIDFFFLSYRVPLALVDFVYFILPPSCFNLSAVICCEFQQNGMKFSVRDSTGTAIFPFQFTTLASLWFFTQHHWGILLQYVSTSSKHPKAF